MARRTRTDRPSPLEAAQIAAVLALDVEREDALIRERALELLADCERGPPGARSAARHLELAALLDAFEGMPPPPSGRAGDGRASALTNREIAAACRDLVARIDLGRTGDG